MHLPAPDCYYVNRRTGTRGIEVVIKSVFKTVSVVFLTMFVLFSPAASFAAAAPGAQKTPYGGLTPQAAWQQSRQPFQIWGGWGYKPVNGTGLDYSLNYSQEDNELVLHVMNNTRRPVTVKTPTSQLADFALWKDGMLFWRASASRSYLTVVTTQTFKPGEGKAYRERLPLLPAGTYFAQAYFLGETQWHPVVSTDLRIRAYVPVPVFQPLEYALEYLGPSAFNPTPRLRATIKNLSDKTITLPYQYGYQILVKKVGAREYLGHVGMGQSLGTIEKGAARYIFVNLNNLEPGAYQADVRSNITTGTYATVASARFYVR